MSKSEAIVSYATAALLALSSGCSHPEKHASYTVENGIEQAAPVLQISRKYATRTIRGDIPWNLARDAYGSGIKWKILIKDSGFDLDNFNPKRDLKPDTALLLYLTDERAERFTKLHPERKLVDQTPVDVLSF